MRIKLKFYTTVLLLVSFAATHVCANGIDAIVGYDTARRIAANTAGELMFDDYGDIVSGNILDAKTVIDEKSAAISAILENQDNVQVHVVATDDDREKIFKAILAERLLAKKMDGWETETVNPYAAMLASGKIRADLVGHYHVLELMYSLADGAANIISQNQYSLGELRGFDFDSCNGFCLRGRTEGTVERWIEETTIGLDFALSMQSENSNLGAVLMRLCLESVESDVDLGIKPLVKAHIGAILEMENHPLTGIAKIAQDLCLDTRSDLSLLVNIQQAIKNLAHGDSVYKMASRLLRVSELRKERQELVAKATSYQRQQEYQEKRIAELRAEEENCQKELEELEERIAELRAKEQYYQLGHKDLEEKIERTQLGHKALEEQIERMQRRHKDLEEKIERTQRRHKDLEEKTRKAEMKDLETEKPEMLGKVACYQLHQRSLEEKIAELRAEVGVCQRHQQPLEEKIAALREEASHPQQALHFVIEELKSLADRVWKLDAEMGSLENL
ncbi:MAG: hypothetical protein V4482_05405 [Pseudomonadota bacterium]